jgi:DNA-binding CsgD family transcriptional regulator
LIYGLIDPRDKQLRYVGKSCDGLRRPRQHAYSYFLKNEKGHKTNWIKGLVKEGLRPEIWVIEEFADRDLLIDAEVFWIAYFKFIGCRLTNLSKGGEGANYIKTEETRNKSSVAAFNRWGGNGFNHTKTQLVIAEYRSGKTLRQIANLLNTSSSTVFYALKKANEHFRDRYKHPKRDIST